MSRCLAGFLRFAPKTRPALRLSGTKNLHFAGAPFPRFSAYAQRDNEAEFVFLARDTQTRYVDNRPLLAAGKPELRRYTAVYVVKDEEIGHFSDELVVSCAP